MQSPTRHWRVLTIGWLLASTAVSAAEVSVAVAANFAAPMARLAAGFAAASGHALKTTTGSTGRFYSQIRNGAPFEVLLAADDTTPQRLITEGHAVAGSRFTYAIGALVLWSAEPGLVDDQGAVLASGRFQKLAVANPKLAPYGQAAMQVLQARGLTERLAPKLVVGESIAQAYQFVATGNAELGFVALSQVIDVDKAADQAGGKPVTGSFWRVPARLHAEIRQDAVLLKPGENKPAAAALLAYLKTPAALALIQRHGYSR